MVASTAVPSMSSTSRVRSGWAASQAHPVMVLQSAASRAPCRFSARQLTVFWAFQNVKASFLTRMESVWALPSFSVRGSGKEKA